MKNIIVAAMVALASAGAHAAEAECSVPKAFATAWDQSLKRQGVDNTQIMADLNKLNALNAKAGGRTGPIGDYLTPAERIQFDTLADDLTLTRLRIDLESARQRHIELLQRMHLLAGRNWFKSEIVTDEADDDYFLQAALLLIQNNYKAGTVASPGANAVACSIPDSLAQAQNFVQAISSGNGAHAVPDNVASYLVAVELIKKMNAVSEAIYRMDMVDAVKASKGSADIAAVLGESVSAAIASGRVDAETAGMMKLWRLLDDRYPSEAVRQSGVLDAR